MQETEMLKKYRGIADGSIGVARMMLREGRVQDAIKELDITVNKLDELDEYYGLNNANYMCKIVDSHKDWKKEGGLYRNWKLGVKTLREAFKIIQADCKSI